MREEKYSNWRKGSLRFEVESGELADLADMAPPPGQAGQMPHKKHAEPGASLLLPMVPSNRLLPYSPVYGIRLPCLGGEPEFGETKNRFDALGLDKASVTGRVGARIKQPHRDVLCAMYFLPAFYTPSTRPLSVCSSAPSRCSVVVWTSVARRLSTLEVHHLEVVGS